MTPTAVRPATPVEAAADVLCRQLLAKPLEECTQDTRSSLIADAAAILDAAHRAAAVEGGHAAVSYVLLGDPEWPDEIVTADAEYAHAWFEEHQEAGDPVRVERRTTARTLHLASPAADATEASHGR